jgi:plasmid segregation protein ParM
MFVLGLDIGYSNVKLAMGESSAPPIVSLSPAGAGPVDRLPESLGKSDDVLCVTVGDALSHLHPPRCLFCRFLVGAIL